VGGTNSFIQWGWASHHNQLAPTPVQGVLLTQSGVLWRSSQALMALPRS